MNKRKWIFISNTFEVATRGSHRRMLSITTDTHSKLSAEVADPDIQAIFDDYDPVHAAYVLIYGNYDTVAGIRKGQTLNFKTYIGEILLTELRKWEGAVRNIHVEDSPEELAIFPNKRTPFIKGTYEERINAVNGLKGRLTADGNFATLVTQVQSFYNILLSARNTQQQKEGLLGQLIDLREQQRILTAEALDGFVLSGLKRKFRSDLSQVERFFNLSLLRAPGEEEVLAEYEGSLAAGAFISFGALADGAKKIRLTIVSGGPGEAGLGVINDVFNGNTMALQGPGEIENPIDYFNSAGNIVILYNQNGTLPLQYKVEVLG